MRRSLKSKILLRLAPIFLFVCVLVSINFFHTESSPAGARSCPACHFLSSALATLAIIVAALVVIFAAAFLAIVDPVRVYETVVFDSLSRSPPSL